MMRVPGSLGDAGFHRESQEDAHLSNELGEEAPTEIGTPTASLSARSTDQQGAGRSLPDGIEEALAIELEEKPLPPPQAPMGMIS
ncbi:hypothetical protein PC128_g24036 [Phytophthora cactorum]|nr:hypothetical protein PC120_g23398 [Phytophthora cactorum]KAG3043672.1 hypothetical protein PC121_g22403 [Phytophthora cactorum]KAG3146391.1 hypothetical protein PC128_g24036 [Phytophthora cactorum]KAG4039808.1 hypothetical protein PC123_g24650 [Phytophthora cactorum]